MSASQSGVKSRKTTPPSVSYMNNEQFASYLSNLRNNRMARPGGARPQPSAPRHSLGERQSLETTSSSHALAMPGQLRRKSSQAPSVSSRYSSVSRPRHSLTAASPVEPPLRPSEVVPTATYMDGGRRWMEKEEVHSLRDAMAEMDMRQEEPPSHSETTAEEQRIYNSALDEAAELVWQHQHPDAAPRPDRAYRYPIHLRKNSYAHARAANISNGRRSESSSRSVSGSSSSSLEAETRSSLSHNRPHGSTSSSRRRSSMKRNISGEVQRPFSGDQIWEEPESWSMNTSIRSGGGSNGDGDGDGRASPEKLSSKPPDPLNRVRFAPAGEAKRHDRVEIHRNPPSQTRNAQYRANISSAIPPPRQPLDGVREGMKDGREIRSQDIRDATSMRMRDRSPRLPEPTAVSDSPGRPIVSFKADWTPPEATADVNPARQSLGTSRGTSHGSVPSRQRAEANHPRVAIPTICVEEDVSTAHRPLPVATIPSICVDDCETSSAKPPSSKREVPRIAMDHVAGDQAVPAALIPGGKIGNASRSSGHWSPAAHSRSRATAVCHGCGRPIDGRFVALAGCSERFHPQCFACFTCGTGLEAMEISPEPEQVRKERLDRISRRGAGEILEETPGMTAREDGDERLRFYCHLDWHELFAPRCKHCTTPILEEHIVALGAHWHYGHFFCAECGDPFEHGMTHIEKDGYAWCIKCQTKRTERKAPKCLKCRQAVIGEYIEAMGGEWHEHCFRCADCRGRFDDGQVFPKEVDGRAVVLCTTCRMRELKA